MTEKSEKLQATLKELEDELASLDSLDEESRSALETALEEISVALQRSDDPSRTRDESLVARLQDAAGEFETSHPNLFGIVHRTIHALGQMGI